MKQNNSDCVFCKIIAGEIPSYTVYEDDIVKAFLDISQVTPGHVLMVPKTHLPNIFAYTSEQAGEVFSRLPKVANAIKAFDSNIQGMNICINNGELAYQSVFHSHIHLIPRYTESDGFALTFADNTDQYEAAQLQQLADQIKANIGD
ncbi:HIT family protein [Bombilactobacillus folatiphilus]|uniref:HIT family protein n=1 Tax=Bombilactobacillus folatiphilus TaxID=2923362 RepID=A0ABY4PAS3_9LACO|nr:HIT family protein [Bombilactobacillus folatiphilus]UQS82636.1 HIT family protein [Bombilactobacillus folatiphilus]